MASWMQNQRHVSFGYQADWCKNFTKHTRLTSNSVDCMIFSFVVTRAFLHCRSAWKMTHTNDTTLTQLVRVEKDLILWKDDLVFRFKCLFLCVFPDLPQAVYYMFSDFFTKRPSFYTSCCQNHNIDHTENHVDSLCLDIWSRIACYAASSDLTQVG